MRRPRAVPTWRDALIVLWLAALLVTLSQLGAAPPAGSGDAEAGRGKPRDVPMAELRARIAADQLSRHPALWAEPLSAGDADGPRGVRRLPRALQSPTAPGPAP